MNTSLKAIFGLDATGLKTELTQIGAKIRSTANQWGKFAAAAAVGVFAKLTRDAISLGSELDNTARKLGITTDLIQTLGFAGEQFGVRQDTTNMALQRFTRRLGEAQQGGGELLPVLQQYGIALTDANGRTRSASDVLGDYAELLRKTPTQQERLRLAFKAFDSEGVGLVNVLQDGKAGLKAFQDQAVAAGAVLDRDTIAKLAEAENAINNFKRRITVAVGNIIVNFRTEEGLELLKLQFQKVTTVFMARIVDAVTYPARVAFNVFGAVFQAVAANLRNGLITNLKIVAQGLNKILPNKFQISIAGLDRLKATGTDVGDAITRAIANTNPAALSETVGEAYDHAIAAQKAIIENQIKEVGDANKDQNDTIKTITDAMRDAAADLAKATAALAEARSDFTAATLDELRNGTRGTASQRVAADAIAQNEELARRLRDTGNAVTRWDSALGRNVQVGSEFFLTRALEARAGLSNLKSSEREPFRKMEDAVVKSETHLKEISKNFTPAQIN